MRKVKNHRPPKNDLTGQKFGHLEVLKMAQTEKSGKRCCWRAICKCHNCGNENFDANVQNIKRGRTGSCGCDKSRYDKTRGKNSSLYTGYEEISGKLWGTIKTRAKRKGRDLDVDIKYAWELYVEQDRKCALSGLTICFGIANHKTSCTTASLDRIDSAKGYIKGNVQWVHKSVNLMKNDLPEDVFIGICDMISGKFKDIDKPDIKVLSKNHFIDRGKS